MADEEWVRVEAGDGIAILTLNDPATRNAISGQAMIDALVEALQRADADPSVRCLILTGAGESFCSGGNIKDMANRQGMFSGSPETLARRYREGIQRIPRTFASLRKPVIAAVNGAAFGAGCDLAMMCDLRIASDQARFAENFVRLGLVPGDGGAWFLPRVIGQARASEMALTGAPVDADIALQWGMVSRVVPAAELAGAARALAGQIAANPPWAVEMTRQLLRDAQSTELPSFLERTAVIQGLAHHTEDHHEAVRALLEKRQPRFDRPGSESDEDAEIQS